MRSRPLTDAEYEWACAVVTRPDFHPISRVAACLKALRQHYGVAR